MTQRNLILIDGSSHTALLPLTFTRPVAELRCGILTISDKWAKRLGGKISWLTQEHLSKKFELHLEDENFLIAGAVLPSKGLVNAITQMPLGSSLKRGNSILAAHLDRSTAEKLIKDGGMDAAEAFTTVVTFQSPVSIIQRCWDIFSLNDEQIRADYELLTSGRQSAALPEHVSILGDEVFVEEGTIVAHSILNSETGPIYIGADSEIMEGSLVRGPFALGEQSTLKMGAKIYGATTIGPHSKIGGEVNNCVIQGFSNKAHDGFLGNSVVGEWCNLGADTNCSNLKNDYGNVHVWNYGLHAMEDSGKQFCGLIMGDFSKCGINTMFNTGTSVGVNVNIFGAGFPEKFVPSFTWGIAENQSEYRLEKALGVAKIVADRRGVKFAVEEEELMTAVFELTKKDRQKGKE